MCTLTWIVEESGYQLFFNRDELRSRKVATPPQTHEEQGVRFIAPTDTDEGGTWIATNHFGVTLCLLNNYKAQAALAPRTWISRGLLVKHLACMDSINSIDVEINTIALQQYRPFDLILFSADQPPTQFAWNGEELSKEDQPRLPITSSSFETTRITRKRQGLINQGIQPDAEQLMAFHRSHHPEKGATSVCMHRSDASTVSFSRIQVTPDQTTFDYWDGPPCEDIEPVRCHLERKKLLNVENQINLRAQSSQR